jgi:hypothetical protein
MTTNLAAETRAIKRTLELLFGKDRVRVRRIRGTGADHPHIVADVQLEPQAGMLCRAEDRPQPRNGLIGLLETPEGDAGLQQLALDRQRGRPSRPPRCCASGGLGFGAQP